MNEEQDEANTNIRALNATDTFPVSTSVSTHVCYKKFFMCSEREHSDCNIGGMFGVYSMSMCWCCSFRMIFRQVLGRRVAGVCVRILKRDVDSDFLL